MSQSLVHARIPPSRSRFRRLRWLVAGMVAAIAIVVGVYIYLEYAAEQELLDAIAEADRLDPGWRFEDLEAARAVVPDAENSVLLVRGAFAKLPVNWPAPGPNGTPNLVERLAALPPQKVPGAAELHELRGELSKLTPALMLARPIADRPHGRYTVAWSPDRIGTLVGHLQDLRPVTQLLALDALLHAIAGDGDAALQACRAMLNTGRSIGDEPIFISQLVRIRCGLETVQALERALAHSEAGADSLASMQRLLADETAAPALLIAARAYRVDYFQALETMRTGQFDRAAYRLMPSRLGERFDTHLDGMRAQSCEAAYLRHGTAVVAIVQLPTHTQEERLQALGAPTQKLPALLEALMAGDMGWVKQAQRFHRAQAALRCAEAAMAAERYRLSQQCWPDDLAALVPRYLAAVPTDPFDGKPLRLRRLQDGIVIYSVNADRLDNDGRFDRKNLQAPDTDIGFQLWDGDRRATQPARD
jgi:hypothetical protein